VQPVIIGDTPLDIIAAQASGIPVIAVATGIYSVDDLTRHKPNAVIDNYDDVLELTNHVVAASTH
jgi:phosphoglycolate phosphatase-like HAD superfamily hydrolase